MTAMIIGSIVGTLLGTVFAGISVSGLNFDQYDHIFKAVFIGILFGSIVTYVFLSWERISTTENLIHEERIKRLTSEKKVAEANLKLLQAQIEPHFLFNTLSNVLSLLDTDPPKGKSMLVDFIQYLRASLLKIREEKATLGQEMDMIDLKFDGKNLSFKRTMGAGGSTIEFEGIVEGDKISGKFISPMGGDYPCFGQRKKLE